MIENIGNCVHFEPCVDRVEHRAAGGHTKMRFGLCGQVGDQRSDDVTRGNAELLQS